ncbi:hypothetical protein [Mucilaginibacter sp.]|uniref:hypothetical protein n=1 Tax=Mucilaginibacter sp. TaxID=1882438 RepID=UPI0025DAD038|nr:hypothetical protein [Mucilaginibacter sp.]
MMNNTALIPNISVGLFKLGDNINNYNSYKSDYNKKSHNDEYMEDYYEFVDPPLIVFVNGNNEITTINCNVECLWEGINLIGFLFDAFLKLASIKPNNHELIYVLKNADKGQNQHVYTFENFGIQVWTWRNKIVTVSCTSYNV